MSIKPADFRCEHSHTGLEHRACYLRHIESNEPEEVGFLDIESCQLTADYGFMLSWSIKPKGKKVVFDYIKRKDFDNSTFDKRIVSSLIKEMNKYKVIYTYYGCLTSENRVLTSDLHWVPVKELNVGDKLLAFDENAPTTKSRRKWKESEVTANIPFLEDVYEVELSDGTKIKATGDHPWLIRTSSGYAFVKTLELGKNWETKRITRLITPWNDNEYVKEKAWLGGFFDGEGSLSYSQKDEKCYSPGSWGMRLQVSQNQNEALDYALQCLNLLKVDYHINMQHNKIGRYSRKCRSISILGTFDKRIALLGALQPKRLLPKFDINKLGALKVSQPYLDIIKVSYIGKEIVYGLGTTTQTYIAEGFGMHNTRFDIPFIRTRAMKHGLDFPLQGSIVHRDLYFAIRSKMRLTSNRLANVTRFLGIEGKTALSGELWAKAAYGDAKSIAYIVHHNAKDVEILETLFNRIRPYMALNKTSI